LYYGMETTAHTEKPLAHRIALVTGGSRGIGRAISIALAEQGAIVAVNYAKDADAAEDTVATIRAAGGTAQAFGGNIATDEGCTDLAAEVRKSLGAPDILIHCAGVASRGKNVASTDGAEVVRLLSTHAIGPHMLSRELIPGMRDRVAEIGRADIIFISSVATDHMAAYGAPYNMGKAAMEALALTLSKEEARNGIRVNIVAPGLVVTDMGKRLIKATAGVDEITSLDSSYPFGRVTRPEDVADVVLFLCRRPGILTGQRIAIDGGPR
jgi:3-oxoacyl-[acyl-carrier protein] reductase